MKKALIAACLLLTGNLFAQEEGGKSTIVNAELVYGLGNIYDSAGESGAVGLGAGVWLPFKSVFIDLGLDFTSSSSRNNVELQFLFDYPFSIMADSTMELKGYIGAGIALGRMFNKEDFFWEGVDDFNDGGVLGNIGLELKPNNANYAFYLDAKTGIVSVPKWAESVTTPFKISLGCRFLLDNSK